MEPDSIDTSSIAISRSPREIDSQIAREPTPSAQHTPYLSITSSTSAPMDTTLVPDSPPLTLALEALLGGLDSSVTNTKAPNVTQDYSIDAEHTQPNGTEPVVQVSETSDLAHIRPSLDESVEDIVDPSEHASVASKGEPIQSKAEKMDGEPTLGSISESKLNDTFTADTNPGAGTHEPIATGLSGDTIDVQPKAVIEEASAAIHTHIDNIEASSNTVQEGTESAAPIQTNDSGNSHSSIPIGSTPTDVVMGENDNGIEGQPEWEVDSSPIESSSDDSSDDTSSDESEDGDQAYKLLSPEEQAKILMAGDGGSDDEGDPKAKGVGGQLRTKNEVPEVIIPKPDVTVTPEMAIVGLGVVQTIVDQIVLVKANTSGEYRVLESGSVLCLQDRTVIGVVAETLGRVQQPLYSIMFTNAESIKESGLSIGTQIFYSEGHASYVFTQALKAYKGSDASNLHDEEVGAEEMEFSDDEAEAEHKRRVKQKRNERNGVRARESGLGRSTNISQQALDTNTQLNYDEVEDGPYKTLARPLGIGNSIGHGEAPQEGSYSGNRQPPGQLRGRGRGDRGRARGERGRGRGNFNNRGAHQNGYSQPPQQRPTSSHQSPPAIQPSLQTTGNGFAHAPYNQPSPYNVQPRFQPGQPQTPAWPQNTMAPPFSQQQPQQPYQQQGFQAAYQNMQNMQWPGSLPPMPGPPSMTGTYINPAFFGSQQNQQQNQWNQQYQPGQGDSRGR